MTELQKIALVNFYECYGEADKLADNLFRALEINNIEFEPLTIPVFNLELEKFIPTGYLSEFIKKVPMEKLMRLAIMFDIYFPSKKWVANILTHKLKTPDYKGYRAGAIYTSVGRTLDNMFDDDMLLRDIPLFKVNEKRFFLGGILINAVNAYLNKKGINHPIDNIQGICKDNYLLLEPDKIDTFIRELKK